VIYIQGTSSIPMQVAIGGYKPPKPLSQSLAIGPETVLAFSPDGKRIAYLAAQVENPSSPSASKPNQMNVIAFDRGSLLQQLDWPAAAGNCRWAPGGEAIDYALTRNGVSNIWRQKLAGGAPTQITNFHSGQIFHFEWSRDGTQLALTRGSASSDVILIRNVR
jgi:Tol biopolymer transport system component